MRGCIQAVARAHKATFQSASCFFFYFLSSPFFPLLRATMASSTLEAFVREAKERARLSGETPSEDDLLAEAKREMKTEKLALRTRRNTAVTFDECLASVKEYAAFYDNTDKDGNPLSETTLRRRANNLRRENLAIKLRQERVARAEAAAADDDDDFEVPHRAMPTGEFVCGIATHENSFSALA